ncbi:MAG: hypothetical protein HYR70_05070 [Chloroflexi bacterium]|nr:hypothetical protein [Chloroflexota bacterium]MBI3338553.1 hypothetical protein [Chloroflexota bacterium]
MLKNLRNSITTFFDKPRLRLGTVPVLIVGIAFLALGLLTLNLGFFQDDWPHVYYFSRASFDGLRQFLLNDSRPLAFVVYDTLFALLGVKPLAWHLAIFVFRTLTVLAFWGVLNVIWDGFKKENAIAALLFLLYPVYLLQPLSVAYSLHWSMFLVYMLSVLFMLLSVRKPRYFLLFTILSIVLQVFQLLMIEYYFGLELLRGLLLWLVLRDEPIRLRLKRTLLHWLPYLFFDLLYVFYRASYSQLYGYERFGTMTFFTLIGQPLAFLSFYLRAAFQDLTEILFSSWYDTFNPSLFDFSTRSGIFIWISVLLAIFGLWAYLRLLRGEEHTADGESRWARQMVQLGLAAILLGVLPGWVVGNTVFGSNPLWNDRFALASMFGAAMVWTGVIYLLVPNSRHRYLLLSILISLAVGINLRTQINYKRSWEKQLNFYWQLAWRAPSIQPHTLLTSDSEFLFFMGATPTVFAVNTLYPQSIPFPQLTYWVASGTDRMPSPEEFRAGVPLQLSARASNYEGVSTDSITINYQPEEGQCLWVLSPQYGNYPFLSPGTLETLPVSSVNRISSVAQGGWIPSPEIFGREPKRSWCFYFEKADLAAQYANWEQVLSLWKEAQEKGLRPGHGVELFPFVRAYAMQNQWSDAVQLTITSSKVSSRMNGAICNLWSAMKADSTGSASRQDALQTINDRFQCGL